MAATALLVVPDPTVSKYLARALARYGFLCRQAASVAEAVEELAAGGEYAVIVVDLDLLGSREEVLLAEFRTSHPTVLVIALDSMAGHHEPREATAPFDVVVPKPFVLRPLLGALRRVVPSRSDATAT